MGNMERLEGGLEKLKSTAAQVMYIFLHATTWEYCSVHVHVWMTDVCTRTLYMYIYMHMCTCVHALLYIYIYMWNLSGHIHVCAQYKV